MPLPTLPTVGGSVGSWGTELNVVLNWILAAFNADGTLKDVTPLNVAANIQTASYVLVLADSGKAIEMNVAGANTLTIPQNSSVAFPVGTTIEICQIGAGQTTVVAGTGTTLRAPSGAKLRAQYSAAYLRKRATNEWVLGGDVIV